MHFSWIQNDTYRTYAHFLGHRTPHHQRVSLVAPEPEAGSAGNHEQPVQARQVHDDIGRQGIGDDAQLAGFAPLQPARALRRLGGEPVLRQVAVAGIRHAGVAHLRIQRIDPGPRMSEASIHAGVAYLAGQVPLTPDADIETQTREVLAEIDELLAIMARLRDPQHGCDWDRAQTFATIAPYTIEEAYEVADAIDRNDLPALKDELGDLLLQVIFHSRMAQELGAFDLADVIAGVRDFLAMDRPSTS